MTEKKDMLDFCKSTNQQHKEVSDEDFKQIWCSRCRNQDCVNANWGRGNWMDRMRTQEDRLLVNPKFADPRDPEFTNIRNLDFKDMANHAISVVISSQRGDWEIPTQQEIEDWKEGSNVKNPSSEDREVSSSAEEVKPDVEVPIEKEIPQEKSQRPLHFTDLPQIPSMNTPVPDGGIMLGAPLKKEPKRDPWEPPSIKGTVVKVGAKIRMGLGGVDPEREQTPSKNTNQSKVDPEREQK